MSSPRRANSCDPLRFCFRCPGPIHPARSPLTDSLRPRGKEQRAEAPGQFQPGPTRRGPREQPRPRRFPPGPAFTSAAPERRTRRRCLLRRTGSARRASGWRAARTRHQWEKAGCASRGTRSAPRCGRLRPALGRGRPRVLPPAGRRGKTNKTSGFI